VNLLPFLTGKTKTVPHDHLKWRYTVGTALRADDWKLVSLPDRLPMLYNLAADPAEQNDLALEHLDRTREMLGELGRWKIHSPHPLFREPASWRVRHLRFYDSEYPITQPE
jgi:arylsulfatase A-like enzyme